MKSIFNPSDNGDFLKRIDQLTPETPAQWGKMNVNQVLLHLQKPLQVALGEHKLKRGLFGILFGGWAKRKLLSDKPWDKGMPTEKTFIIAGQPDFQIEKEKLKTIVHRFLELGPSGLPSDMHPFFGKMTVEEWDALQVKHLDHHLTQFGV